MEEKRVSKLWKSKGIAIDKETLEAGKPTKENLADFVLSLSLEDISFRFIMNTFSDFSDGKGGVSNLARPYDLLEVPANRWSYYTDKDRTVAKANLPSVPAEAQKLYQESYALLNKGDLDAAAKGFKSYTTKYSGNALTPNAWYWLGQIQYKQNKFEDARISFLNTAKFKESDKRADALYKLGVTSKALGDKEKAKKFFDVLIKTYPNASSSALAKKELQSL